MVPGVVLTALEVALQLPAALRHADNEVLLLLLLR